MFHGDPSILKDHLQVEIGLILMSVSNYNTCLSLYLPTSAQAGGKGKFILGLCLFRCLSKKVPQKYFVFKRCQTFNRHKNTYSV